MDNVLSLMVPRLSLLCTPSSAKLVIVQCCKLIVMTPFRLTVVISRKLGLTPLICETEPSEI